MSKELTAHFTDTVRFELDNGLTLEVQHGGLGIVILAWSGELMTVVQSDGSLWVSINQQRNDVDE